MQNQMYGSPIYPSPSVPQMVAPTPYYNNGLSPAYNMMAPQQTPAGFYPPMGSMQMNGQPQVMMQQQYPDFLPGRQPRSCCDCCCDCSCCNCCLGIFASLCICCFCCGDEADECCC